MTLYTPCAAGTCRYYIVAQETITYPKCETGVTPIKKKQAYTLARYHGKQGKGGVIVHTDKGNSLRYSYVGNNWAYNINFSIGGWNDTHTFAEVKEKGKYRLVIKPIRGRTTLPGQEIKYGTHGENLIIVIT
jgi:hypothetical protein